MTNNIEQLEKLVEARKKATAGPWRWNVNRKYKQCHLEGTPAKGCEYVIDFVRWGMGGSAPRFRTPAGIMQRVDELSVPVRHREHHEHWYRTVEHPDADFIALAGSIDLPAILAEMKEQQAKIEKLEKVVEAAVENAECALSALQCGNADDGGSYPVEFMEKIEEYLSDIIEPPSENSNEH